MCIRDSSVTNNITIIIIIMDVVISNSVCMFDVNCHKVHVDGRVMTSIALYID